jgi:hypothetical protein
MRRIFSGSVFMASVATLGMAAFAQTTPQQSPAPPSQTSAPATRPAAAGQQVTIVGCVQREADYRKAHDDGKGGVAGTGVGAGNEFVLINAAVSAGGSTAAAPTGTAGATGGTAYELTGSGEGQAAKFVNKRVEVMGMFKAAETAAGAPTGGPTAGAPPSGVDVVSKDLKLREFEVSSVKEATGNCPAS